MCDQRTVAITVGQNFMVAKGHWLEAQLETKSSPRTDAVAYGGPGCPPLLLLTFLSSNVWESVLKLGTSWGPDTLSINYTLSYHHSYCLASPTEVNPFLTSRESNGGGALFGSLATTEPRRLFYVLLPDWQQLNAWVLCRCALGLHTGRRIRR